MIQKRRPGARGDQEGALILNNRQTNNETKIITIIKHKGNQERNTNNMKQQQLTKEMNSWPPP